MSAWRSSSQWRPPQFGWATPAEFTPFAAWITPAALGVGLLALAGITSGHLPEAPDRLRDLGIFNGNLAWTLIWSPLWSFPGVLALLLLRWILIRTGCFGWASAVAGGALSGLTIPLMLGENFWLAGPAICAINLGLQQLVYSLQDPDAFNPVVP
jgi:hypothetical protein